MNDNKKIMESTINSVTHYQQEITRLKEAIKHNESLVNELVKSLLEFCPVEEGEVYLINSTRIVKISRPVKNAIVEGGELRFEVYYHRTYKGDDGWCNENYGSYISIKDLNNWRLIPVPKSEK